MTIHILPPVFPSIRASVAEGYGLHEARGFHFSDNSQLRSTVDFWSLVGFSLGGVRLSSLTRRLNLPAGGKDRF